ncbi:MAG: hypothetical protein QME64_10935, partial [bacterium]|nr:hypothetical protein [bacterium]
MIDLTNGNITLEQLLPPLPSRGQPVMIFRSHLSFANHSVAQLNFDPEPLPSFGRGGAWNYYQHIIQEGPPEEDPLKVLALYRGNYIRVAFERNTSGTYESPSGITDKMYLTDSTYERVTKEGMRYVYTRTGLYPAGKLWYVIDPHNNKIECDWLGIGWVLVKDASERYTKFLHVGSGVNERIITQIWQYYNDYDYRTAYFNYRSPNYTYSIMTEFEDFAGRETYYTYDTADHITMVYEPWANRKTLYQYNDQVYWKVTKRKIVDTLSNVTITWTYGYETATEWKSWVIGPQNDTTYYWYNTITWQLDKIQDAKGNITEFEHDHRYNRTKLKDANGNLTQYAYDAYDNLINVTNALGQTAYYYWNTTYNLLTCSVDPLGNRAYYTWDTAKRDLLQVKDPLGNITQFQYDTYGEVTAVIDALNRRTRLVYDTYAQVTSIISPSNETTRFLYDAFGNRTTIIDPLGHRTNYTYDVNRGILTQVTDALQGLTKYNYDLVDRLTTVQDALQRQNTYYYNAFGQLTAERDEANNFTRYLYNTSGDLTSLRDPNGNTIRYWYDTIGQMTAKECTKGSGGSYGLGTVYFSYDSAGNMTTMNDPNIGLVYWYYDKLSRVTTQVCGLGTNRYTYDAAGRRTQMVDPDGNALTYIYDPTGNVYLIQNGFNQFTNYAINSVGLTTEEWYENSVFTSYAYDTS